MATQLENNTSSLQAVLSAVNALPNQSEQATPTIAINSSGLITATAGTKSATKQLTTQAAKTITPSTSSQTAVSSGVYTTGNITVAAIPSSYVQPTSTKSATTYTPTTSNQTISAGTYCSGAQTIKGDSNLVAGNIKSGVSIFGVAGTYTGTNSTNIATKAISLSFNSDPAGLAWTSLNSNGALQQNVFTSAFPTSINAVVGTSVVIFNAAGNIKVDGDVITAIDYSAAIPVSSTTSQIETTHGGGGSA